MNGLILGLIGGAIAGGTSVLGSLTAIFQNNFKIQDEKLIERRLGIIIGLLFMLTAFSYLNPTLDKLYHGGFAADYELWSVVAAFVCGLLLVLLASEFIQDSLAEPKAESIPFRNDHILFLLLILVKNIPEGIAAGAAMNIGHAGISYSLLCFIGLHQLFQGVVAAMCLLSLGLDAELAFVGSLFLGFVAVISGIIGSVTSLEYFRLMPVLSAFAGGAMMSSPVLQFIQSIQRSKNHRLVLNPGVLNGLIIMLVFIIWKEIV
jgi:zinc transporter ZupT